jgi:hypothetical protein
MARNTANKIREGKEKSSEFCYILWQVDPLLDNYREISNYTTVVTMQRSVHNKRETVFSVLSVPGCYKQDKIGITHLVS